MDTGPNQKQLRGLLHANLATALHTTRQPGPFGAGCSHSHCVLLSGPGGVQAQGTCRGYHHPRARRAGRDLRVPDASRHGNRLSDLRLPLRALAHRVDHHCGGISLQAHCQKRPVRDHSQLGHVDHRRPTPTGLAHRLLFRCLPRRCGRLWRASGNHRSPVGRSGPEPAIRSRVVPDRQHRACSIRRTGDSGHRGRPGFGTRYLQDRRDGRPSIAAAVGVRTVLADVHDGRCQGREGNLASSAGRGRQFRRRAIPDI